MQAEKIIFFPFFIKFPILVHASKSLFFPFDFTLKL